MGHGFSVSSFAINTVLSTSDLLGFSEGPKREKCTYGGGGERVGTMQKAWPGSCLEGHGAELWLKDL